MAIHWQVKFKSLRTDTLYTVNIYDDSFSGTAVQLTGSAQPFTTEENDSDDIFLPIRLQSGYIRIVDNGSIDWRDLIPASDLDRPVTLTANGVVQWVGFIQTQNFGAELYLSPQEYSFPLQCSLSVTQGIDVNFQQTDIKNFAYLLYTVFDTIPSVCRPTEFVFQGGVDASQLLSKKIDWRNFVETGDQDEARFTMYEVLEGMARYFGWSVRIKGQTVYFVCPDDDSLDDFYVVPWSDLERLGNETSPSSTSIEYGFLSASITGGFANRNNTDSQLRGATKVEISSDPNTEPDVVFDPFDDTTMAELEDTTFTSEQYNNTWINVSGDVLTIDRTDYFAWCYTDRASFNFVQFWDDQNMGYNDSMNMIMFKHTYMSELPFLSFESKYAHSYHDGFFQFTGQTYRGGEEYVNIDGHNFEGNNEMYVKMGIGMTRNTAKWWNGRAWQSSETHFVMTLGNTKDVFFTRYWASSQNAETTSIILVDSSTGGGSGMYGYLFLYFLGSDGVRGFPETDGQRSFNLRDFKITFTKNETVEKQKFPNSGWYEIKEKRLKTTIYKAQNNNRTNLEYSESNIFASNNIIKPGYAVVLEPDGSYLNGVSYNNVVKKPEEHKAERIANYWAASKRKIETELLSDTIIATSTLASDITPRHSVTMEGTTMHPVSISHDWRDDIVKIVLVEI